MAEKLPGIGWRNVLNPHTTNRPKDMGGSIVGSLEACRRDIRTPDGQWQVRLDLPNSSTATTGVVSP